MKFAKRGAGLTCVLAICLTLCLPASAATGDFDIDGDGTLGTYAGPGGNVVIPDGVTEIAYGAFEGCNSPTSLTIPDSVTRIGDFTFSGCTGLTSVVIGDGVTHIGDYAFRDCANLTSVTIGDGVTSIGDYAFRGCASLTSVTIPDSVTSIGKGAFYDCTNLTSVIIPDSVTSIGNAAFSYCSSLTSVTIPDSVTSISNETFSYCSNLTSVSIPDSVTSIGDNAFSVCNSLTGVTIPNSVTNIGYGAFDNCTSLTSVTIPGSVASIGRAAFWSCNSLTSVTFEAGVQEIGEGIFGFCSSLQDVTIPSSVSTLRGTLFGTYDYGDHSQVLLHVAAGSLAEGYAQANGIACVADQPYIQTESERETVVTAYTSTQTVKVFGAPVEFQMYGLKDTNGYMTNYIKLRDLAYVLPEDYSFNVTWDGAVMIERGVDYVPNGSEMTTPFSGDRPCIHRNTDISLYVLGIKSLDSILLTDDSGGGYTYFKLRDLCDILDVSVIWNAEDGIRIGY